MNWSAGLQALGQGLPGAMEPFDPDVIARLDLAKRLQEAQIAAEQAKADNYSADNARLKSATDSENALRLQKEQDAANAAQSRVDILPELAKLQAQLPQDAKERAYQGAGYEFGPSGAPSLNDFNTLKPRAQLEPSLAQFGINVPVPTARERLLASPVSTSATPEAKAMVGEVDKMEAERAADEARAENIAAREAEAKQRALDRASGMKITAGLKEDQQQEKLFYQDRRTLETSLSSDPTYRVQAQKVDQAVHVRQAMESGMDDKGQFHLNQITSPEVAMGLAALVSGGNKPALAEVEAMEPQAKIQAVQKMIGNFFGKPVDVLTPEWTNTLLHMVDRQGATAEILRDGVLEQYKTQLNPGLSKENQDKLLAFNRGTSYTKFFGLDKGDYMPGELKANNAKSGSASSGGFKIISVK